ncbi:MAG: hypothetical protein OHK0047_35890 [Leptolyngbyaceae cyanobacterium]
MLRVINHKWFRGILVSTVLLVPLGYIGLRNSFAKAQVGTPITPGSAANITIAPSTAPTTMDLSVSSTTSVDSGASPASGLSTSFADTGATLNADEDDTDLVEMAATDEEDPEEAIAEDNTQDHDTLVSQDEADSNPHEVASRLESTDEDE